MELALCSAGGHGPDLGVRPKRDAGEMLPGVHEPHLPSSGSGDHCRGTHNTTLVGLCADFLFKMSPKGLLIFALLTASPNPCGSLEGHHLAEAVLQGANSSCSAGLLVPPESQNHQIIQVGKALQDHPIQPQPVPPCPLTMSLPPLHGSQTPPGMVTQPLPWAAWECLTTFSENKLFLTDNLNLPWCSLRPLPLVLPVAVPGPRFHMSL